MCGPPMMNSAVINMLLDLGVERRTFSSTTSADDVTTHFALPEASSIGGVLLCGGLCCG